MPKYKETVLRARLAANVKAKRIALGWTQEALAEAAGLSQVYLSNIEQSQVGASIDVVEKLSVAFGLDAGALVSEIMAGATSGRVRKAKSN